MMEQDLRDGLAGALADEPPLSFDPDRLVARAQREIRRRRSLVGVGGATAVIAVAAVVTATMLHPTTATAAGPHLGTAPGTTAAAASAQPPNFPWPPAGMHTKSYSVAEEKALAAAWTNHLTQTFGTVVPGAARVTVQPWGGEASGAVSAGQNYLDTFVRFTFHGVPTAVAVQVSAPGQDTLTPAGDCAQSDSPTACVFTRTADGGLLVSSDIVQNNQRLRTVAEYRPDGTVVSVATYNYDPTGTGAQSFQPSVPVTDAQLTSYATDPVFAF